MISYPKTWLTFQASDIDSDDLVEYRICDLTTERFEDTFKLMVNDYLKNEPLNAHLGKFVTDRYAIRKFVNKFSSIIYKCNSFVCFVGCWYDDETIQAYRLLCQSALDQKASIICIKTETEEIVGASILAIISEHDELEKQIYDNDNVRI